MQVSFIVIGHNHVIHISHKAHGFIIQHCLVKSSQDEVREPLAYIEAHRQALLELDEDPADQIDQPAVINQSLQFFDHYIQAHVVEEVPDVQLCKVPEALPD